MASRSGYLPVSEHGLIGDLHTVALVGTNGTIDWHCSPSFDAPSVFGSILDADGGGCFELAAAVPAKTRQFYLPDTNVLITRFSAQTSQELKCPAASEIDSACCGQAVASS
jgi:GH15 family glucan-1,4-alpha-glucosidase